MDELKKSLEVLTKHVSAEIDRRTGPWSEYIQLIHDRVQQMAGDVSRIEVHLGTIRQSHTKALLDRLQENLNAMQELHRDLTKNTGGSHDRRTERTEGTD